MSYTLTLNAGGLPAGALTVSGFATEEAAEKAGPVFTAAIHAHYGISATYTVEREQHIIDLREDGWTIQHEMACRPRLFECAVNRAAERDLAALAATPRPPGRYECGLDYKGGFLIRERVQ
ncbi:hypothetical protein [Nocardiopsis sp. NPDC057823]|uniref:hypothetical protein n=1 Tax=Nocardiopsis sp. NPDC057823 TaxID=3346256 RepID=UPI00366D7818